MQQRCPGTDNHTQENTGCSLGAEEASLTQLSGTVGPSPLLGLTGAEQVIRNLETNIQNYI